MFLSAFMISFFFNWIGFFASICLLPNAAGKYGALSGFGLSMAKWVTIVRVNVRFRNQICLDYLKLINFHYYYLVPGMDD